MPRNITTSFDEFTKKEKSKLNKNDIKNEVLKYLTESETKLNTYDLVKLTGQKSDKVYVSLIEIKAKFKKINDTTYWYIKEEQKDPPIKIINKNTKQIDETFETINKGSGRKVFLTMEDYQKSIEKKLVEKTKKTPKRK